LSAFDNVQQPEYVSYTNTLNRLNSGIHFKKHSAITIPSIITYVHYAFEFAVNLSIENRVYHNP